MIYVLVFHWYGDHFPSQFLLTGRLICYLTHMQTQLTGADDIFRDISSTLYRSLRFSAIDSDRRE